MARKKKRGVKKHTIADDAELQIQVKELEPPLPDPVQALETPLSDPAQALETPLSDPAKALETPLSHPAQVLETPLSNLAQALEPTLSNSAQPTITTTESKQRKSGGVRSVCVMHKVVVKKAQGKKCKVTCNALGIPEGDTRNTLQSYIGMLARTMVPIDIISWPQVDSGLKEKLWLDVQDTFNISLELKNFVLKSAGCKWRQFKTNLTRKFVLPFVGQKKKLARPPKQYAFVGRSSWKKFVAQRSSPSWQTIHEKLSAVVGKRKYHHRLSRKGYIGLKEEEIKSGKLEVDEEVDRAVLWKKARMRKDGMEVDEELAKMNEKIDALLEKKQKGEFSPSGSTDVLTVALETPEHSGRVRAVGSFVTPKIYFNLPRERTLGISKSELMARDRQRSEELEKAKNDLMSAKQEMMVEIEQLKAMINGAHLQSPNLSDKASFHPLGAQDEKKKPKSGKVLMLDGDVDAHVAIDNPLVPEKKVARKCELSYGSIDNKVAFGVVFDVEHGRDMPPGCLRVSVDGCTNPDALLPVPVPGEMEFVRQAVGSLVAWPVELISFPQLVQKELQPPKKGDPLKRLQTLYSQTEPPKSVPKRWRLIYKHAMTLMKNGGASIQIQCHADVFGKESKIYLLHEHVLELLHYKMIGQAVISAYMRYLYTKVHEANELNSFGFLHPALTFNLDEDFESYVVKRLTDSNDRIHFIPHNSNMHWILSIIWDGDIYILNPLSLPSHFPLEKALQQAVKSFNSQTGRGKKMPKVKNLIGCPKQPGGHECGYVVMRYMKEIIEDFELSFPKKWSAKNQKCYTVEQLEEVRNELLGYIEEHM